MYKEKKNNGHEKYINKTFNIKKKKNPLKKKKKKNNSTVKYWIK